MSVSFLFLTHAVTNSDIENHFPFLSSLKRYDYGKVSAIEDDNFFLFKTPFKAGTTFYDAVEF